MWLVFKSGFRSRAGFSGAHTVINQSFLSENSTTYLTLQTACLKLKAGPNLAHFSSSTKFSPLRRGRAEFGQREFAWQTHTKTNTTLEKGLCLSANTYICNQLNLPLQNCHSVFIFFFNYIFSNAKFSFLFLKFYCFNLILLQRSHSCF